MLYYWCSQIPGKDDKMTIPNGLSDKDLTLLLNLVNQHRKNCSEKLIASARRVYMREADGIHSELVRMRDQYRKNLASLTLAHTGRGIK